MPRAGDVDYLIAGTVLPTASKGAGDAASWAIEGCERSSRATQRAGARHRRRDRRARREVAAAGAAGVAAIGLFMGVEASIACRAGDR